LLLGALIHFGFGWLLTFSVDEAHYALYAIKLDWSYFDHPPMVGWIQWPLIAIDAPVAVIRLIPEGLWLLACLLAWQVARHPAMPAIVRGIVGNTDTQTDVVWTRQLNATGLWAVALIFLAPVMHVLAVGLLPDTLLMVVSLAILKITMELCQANNKILSLSRWLQLGLLLGLAGLSKYTAVFPAFAATAVLLGHHGLKLFKQLGPWLAISLAIILVAPVFYWNAQHDWISFLYQLRHGSGGDWELKRLLVFFLVQFGAFGPLLVGTTLIALWLGIRQKNTNALLLMLFFIVPFTITALLAGGGGLPHWTAPAWLAATPFAARLIAQDWLEGRRRKLICGLAAFQTLSCVVAFALLFFVGIPGVSQNDSLGRKNPFSDLWGWDKAGEAAKEIAVKLATPAISVRNWTLASRLAWYSKPLPVFVLDNRFDQFDIWFGQVPAGSDTIFVNWSQMAFDLPVGPKQFESCDLVTELPVYRLGRVVSDFSFYHCKHWGKNP